ncbi:LacI family DNA-binding transcriptional regulator [Pseudonocardia acaciae]|uniref:LacI family DNA-binding transcriptional regulator n=1 Tax=Pseudonocardia acaciae TaxID=551276 RepID=UPI00048F1873|nr:LacI family DNA-binding transcriptional regulator [Pseudonocardia acaciae]
MNGRDGGRRVRLRDVAAAAETSAKTVSRVINGDPRVAPETRGRVQRAVLALGYQPDPLARSLRRGTDDTIGVVVDSVADPFFASVAGQIERVALSRGISVMIASTNRDQRHERELLTRMVQRRVAGLILAPISTEHSHVSALSCPVVFVDRRPSGADSDSVVVDDADGARTAVRHLIAHGHRRIAFLGLEPELDTTRLRLDGYRAALAEAGIAPAGKPPGEPSGKLDDELVVTCDPDSEQLDAETIRLLDSADPPTAIFSPSTRCSLRVLPVLHRLGRRDVAFVGFGDLPLAESISPGVTVIDHPPDVIGRLAAERLMDRIAGKAPEPATLTVPLRLVPRGSGEVPA